MSLHKLTELQSETDTHKQCQIAVETALGGVKERTDSATCPD